jgi:hypothetical protein
MWTLLLTWSMTASFFNAWFMVPLLVIALLSVRVYSSASKRPVSELGALQKIWMTIVLPTVIVIAVPNFVFRVINGYVDTEHLLLPLGMHILVAVIFGLAARVVFSLAPAGSVFVAGILTYLYLLIYQPDVVRLTSFLSEKHAVVSNLLALLVCAGFAVVTYILVWRPMASRLVHLLK